MGSRAHLTGTSRLQLLLPPLLQSPPRSLPKHYSPQGPRHPLRPSSPDRGNCTLLPSVILWPGMMMKLHRGSQSTKHFFILSVVKSLGAVVTSGVGVRGKDRGVTLIVQELCDLGQGLNLSEPQFPPLYNGGNISTTSSSSHDMREYPGRA